MQSKPRKFRGFAVLDRQDGALIWGTFRPNETDALAVYDRWNPPLTGQAQTRRVVRVEISIIDNNAQ